MAKGFKVADAYIEVHLDDDAAKREVAGLPGRIGSDTDRAGTTVGRRMGQSIDKSLASEVDKSGRKNGDKLSQGINLAIVRNSPLIAAGVGAALSAGAPAAIAGATALFAGIGIVAAAQNEQVQKAWSNTWDSIKAGTEADATVLQGTLINMAGQIEKGFSTLRPALRLMFADAAPLLENFTASLVNAAQNAMPGLVAAVHAAGPVFQGLGSMVESIGTGLSGFFEAISQHGSAAGQAFQAIGQIVATLLPILGDLLGQGAELAADVLPAVASVLGVVADALHTIAPILPTVVAGFLAFKAADAVTDILGKFGSSVGDVLGKLKGLVSGPGSPVEAASALGSLKNAMGPVSVAFGLIGAAIVQSQQQINDWAQALLAGGSAAQQAQQQMSGIEDFFNNGATSVGSATLGWTNWANALGVGSNASETAKQKANELLAAMTPLQQAQQAVTAATNDLNVAVNTYGADSPQAAYAAGGLAQAQAEVAFQNNAAQLAIEGVTNAMIAQANQALAAASSSFAYDQATQQVADAQQRLIDLQNSGTASSSDLNNATNSLNQALLSQATAAGRLASDSLPASASELDHNTASAQATLAELYKLRDQMGAQFPAALQTAINGLEASGAAMANTGGQASGASGQVQGLATQLINAGVIHVSPTIGINNQASAILQTVQNQIAGINSKTVTITTVYRQSGITAGAGMTTIRGQAMGGRVGDVIKAASGRVVGPGSGTSDSVPAIGPGGRPWALSNGEWVIREAAVRALERAFGPGAMPAINSGRLPVATASGSSGAMAKVQGGGITIQNMTVQIAGTYDLASSSDLRKAAQVLEQELIKLGREQR